MWLKIILLIFILIPTIFAFFWACKLKTKETFHLFGLLFLIFVVIYSVSILGYRITGTNFGIEKAKSEIEASKKEISEVANTLVKMAYIIADGSERWDGMPPEHFNKIKQYRNEIKSFLDPELDKEIQETIKCLNEEINNRTENKK
jgi:gas vesicle protein